MNKLIMDTLKPLRIPVSFQKYTGRKDTYIIFHEYFTGGEEYEDDNEVLTAHYVQVDIWSKTDYTNIVKQVKAWFTEVPKEPVNSNK